MDDQAIEAMKAELKRLQAIEKMTIQDVEKVCGQIKRDNRRLRNEVNTLRNKLKLSEWSRQLSFEKYEVVKQMCEDRDRQIAVLTLDAQAWREQEARRKTEQDEMQKRIDDCRNGVG